MSDLIEPARGASIGQLWNHVKALAKALKPLQNMEVVVTNAQSQTIAGASGQFKYSDKNVVLVLKGVFGPGREVVIVDDEIGNISQTDAGGAYLSYPIVGPDSGLGGVASFRLTRINASLQDPEAGLSMDMEVEAGAYPPPGGLVDFDSAGTTLTIINDDASPFDHVPTTDTIIPDSGFITLHPISFSPHVPFVNPALHYIVYGIYL